MNEIRDRHAMRWVLGTALAFLVVVAMGLLSARLQASERWLQAVAYCEEDVQRIDALESWVGPTPSRFFSETETRGGNVFRGWRRGEWDALAYNLVLLQKHNWFGNSIEARMYLDVADSRSALADAVRELFAVVSIEVVIEPY